MVSRSRIDLIVRNAAFGFLQVLIVHTTSQQDDLHTWASRFQITTLANGHTHAVSCCSCRGCDGCFEMPARRLSKLSRKTSRHQKESTAGRGSDSFQSGLIEKPRARGAHRRKPILRLESILKLKEALSETTSSASATTTLMDVSSIFQTYLDCCDACEPRPLTGTNPGSQLDVPTSKHTMSMPLAGLIGFLAGSTITFFAPCFRGIGARIR
eukprot:gnl/TRDRNA2_/TRDRNA2_202833_c0_seq1.p1 gnl/TRDRNA2_/TRDRNA2_202833_c0~~gnl/TRDRNA2_/TRDRNA2_202833_c0_seq1.p1  ORF type:complete len:212 (-),score=10.74 gnl/TRDRNA2_/TRDRNA2_202833_c0_seq1:577-1212(-)